MRKIHHFYSEIYYENFYFCPNFTDEEYADAIFDNTGMSWTGSVFSKARTTEITHDDGKYFIFIQLKDSKDIESLVHECFHASNCLMNRKGLMPDARNDEAQAYLIQWIFNNCFNHIKKLNEVIKEDSDHLKDAMSYSIQKELDDITIESLCGEKQIIDITKETESLVQEFLKANPKLRPDQVVVVHERDPSKEIIRVESSMSEDKYSKIQSFLEIAHDEIIKIEKNLIEIGCKDGAIMDDLRKVKTYILKVYNDN